MNKPKRKKNGSKNISTTKNYSSQKEAQLIQSQITNKKTREKHLNSVNKDVMVYQDCLICHEEKATKTNSHIIPSFMVAKVCSYDGSGKRDKEVMFTMTHNDDKVYTGALPSTKIEELFDLDKLTDERINKELKNNTASKDYIFCPVCEKRLSDYLESPCAEYLYNGKKVSNDVIYFFWLSIIWRMSISRQSGFALPEDIEQSFGNCLHEYMNVVSKGQDATAIAKKCNFSYRLLRSPSYLPNKLAYLGGRYWEKDGVLTLTLGDAILCVKFDDTPFPENFTYLGLEEVIRSTPVNNGTSEEQYTEIDNKTFEKAMLRMVEDKSLIRLGFEKVRADAIWQKVGLEGNMPNNIFGVFMQKLYSEESKQGDRKTPERYCQIFNETMESFGYESRKKS